jgi:hypothetical protein
MARNLEERVRSILLGQVPASAIKHSERLNFGDAFIGDVRRGKHLIRNRLERGHKGQPALRRQALLRFSEPTNVVADEAEGVNLRDADTHSAGRKASKTALLSRSPMPALTSPSSNVRWTPDIGNRAPVAEPVSRMTRTSFRC